MNQDYDELRAIYRAACADESPTAADRRAVRASLMATIAIGVQAATTSAALGANAATSGATVATTSAIGAKGLFQSLLAGKFLSGLLVGAALGTAVSTTATLVVPDGTPAMAREASGPRERARPPSRQPDRDVIEARPPSRQPDRDVVEASSSPNPQPELHRNAPPGVMAPIDTTLGPNALGVETRPSVEDRRGLDAGPKTSDSLRTEDKLLRETEALGKVQSALNDKDPERALAHLREQAVVFASGQLGEERAAALVLALCAAGRVADAERARARFFASYPNSALSKRVESSCAR